MDSLWTHSNRNSIKTPVLALLMYDMVSLNIDLGNWPKKMMICIGIQCFANIGIKKQHFF